MQATGSGFQQVLQVMRDIDCFNAVFCIEGVGLVPPHPITQREGGPVASHDIIRSQCKVGAQLIQRPQRLLERISGDALDDLGQLAIGNRIAGHIHHLVGDARLGQQYLRGEPANVFRRRDRDPGVPGAQAMDSPGGKVHHVERRLEQEAGEHAGGDDHPLGLLLLAQQLAYVVLLVEHRLAAALSDHIVVNAELPREIALDLGV